MRRVSASGEALYDKQGNKLDRFRDTTSSNLLSNYLLSVCVCVCVCVCVESREKCLCHFRKYFIQTKDGCCFHLGAH